MPLEFRVGDATQPEAEGNKIIVHVCNDLGGWGKGFVVAISRRWKEPEQAYRAWHRGGTGFELGAVQLVAVQSDVWVANLVGQRDVRPIGGQPPIRYEALRQGLTAVGDRAVELQASIHMPRIGCGLAGGEWPHVEAIVNETLIARGLDVFVYDLP